MRIKLLCDYDKCGNYKIYLKDTELYVVDIFPWSEYYVCSLRIKEADGICVYDMIAKDICEVIE